MRASSAIRSSILSVSLLATMACAHVGSTAASGPDFEWANDLESARRGMPADGLVVVHFEAPALAESREMANELVTDAGNRRCLLGLQAAMFDGNRDARLYRDVFDAMPGLATCVIDADGLVVAAHEGYLAPGEFQSFIGRARRGRNAVRTSHATLSRMENKDRSGRRRALLRLAKAYLESGNKFAAHRQLSVVALLSSPGAAPSAEADLACQLLARIDAQRGRTREAREWLGLRLELDKRAASSAGVQLTEALIAASEGRPVEARAILEGLRRVANHSEAARVLFEYGSLCHTIGDQGAAKAAFREIVKRWPDRPIADRAKRGLAHLVDHEPHHHRDRERENSR